MSTMRALVCQGPGQIALVTDRPQPELKPGYVKVSVKAVALNPTDWKSAARAKVTGHLVGCDFAGNVEEIGTGYSKDWKVGDRIAGFVHGLNQSDRNDGAFAEHIVAKADVQVKLPSNLSYEEGATIGVGFHTCGQGLFQTLGLNLPDNPTTTSETILIYAGSTATGALGIQYATAAGYKVITTCSPRNFEYVKSLGAVAAFDYNDSQCASKINEFTGGSLKRIWDTISLEQSAKVCAEVISPGGHYAAILPTKCPRDDVKSDVTMAYTVTGEPINKGWFKKDDTSEDFEFAKKFASITEKLLAEGKLKVHRPNISKSGLEGVVDGLELLKNDKVSGEKLVYAF